MTKWLFGKKIATLPFWHFCLCASISKKFFAKWLLVECFERPITHFYSKSVSGLNWIISSIPDRISEILFVLGTWDHFGSLGYGIGECPFFLLLYPMKRIEWYAICSSSFGIATQWLTLVLDRPNKVFFKILFQIRRFFKKITLNLQVPYQFKVLGSNSQKWKNIWKKS